MNERRHSKIVKSQFQHGLVIRTVLMALISTNIIVFGSFALEGVFGEMYLALDVFLIAYLSLQALAFVLLYLIGITVSYRIAGPVFMVERRLQEMALGELADPLRLRTGDQFDEVADSVNGLLQIYRDRLREAQGLAAKLNEANPSSESADLQAQLEWFVTEEK